MRLYFRGLHRLRNKLTHMVSKIGPVYRIFALIALLKTRSTKKAYSAHSSFSFQTSFQPIAVSEMYAVVLSGPMPSLVKQIMYPIASGWKCTIEELAMT